MLLRHCAFYLLIAVFSSCKTNNQKAEDTRSNHQEHKASAGIDIVDADFDSFIEKFSKDSVFQLERTKFPLKIKQYDIENDKDTIIYEQRPAFEMMDFRQKKSKGSYDQWKQEIVLDKNHSKATIEIRGIENGIVVDYNFEKRDGKWMLISINDSST